MDGKAEKPKDDDASSIKSAAAAAMGKKHHRVCMQTATVIGRHLTPCFSTASGAIVVQLYGNGLRG